MSERIQVTVEGPPITVEISLEQVKEYLRLRGWKESMHFDNMVRQHVMRWEKGISIVILHTFVPLSPSRKDLWWLSDALGKIAAHERRRVYEVVRDIMGEVGESQGT